jgi:hypothetical protein
LALWADKLHFDRYDLKQGDMPIVLDFLKEFVLTRMFYLEISKSPVSKVPAELARHEAAQQKISREMKRKRDAEDQG